ncbi:protein xmas-2 isoform X1 [Lucilia cuprina]|uniref:protein xmas-2 isoform X1 n=2 Tax=Lucilia cuprina TaxID=7375 RepID=UPI001F052827|nr:protein xmas-2 isoform X1 [Lucilia cuprina]
MSEDVEYGTMEDRTNYNAITCEQIPELFLDKIVAKKHFSKFGKIKRFILRPKRLICTVEYENKEDAENAFENAGRFNGVDFIVNYAEHEVAHVQNTEEWVDPDVQAELEAMSPGHRMGASLKSSKGLMAPFLQKTNVLNRFPKYASALAHPNNSLKARQNSPQPEIKVDSMVRNELEAILKTPAHTHEEKYRVLEARDKLIRLTTVRQTDIRKAVAAKGTCPDMCPEKERLMREFQRQVSTFEMAEEEGSESTISHRKAVKEYSRSSADQEVPLAHELRSESVLQMTMLYLVHRIMGLCDDPKTSLGDWFHFVWDRTRSIRKDITQQELCSLGAVQLVEQCARFHIHCAARLVAEDPSVFDKKINAENLTKCLQTLKYMYHDLRIKGIVCPCEAEFRSYVILLNLGDSNFLWEVKQLPEFIQKSKEVKRAIAFYNALQNNNFVRFFSMIKSNKTSYLSACILLGYFTKLRVRAMDAIIKSHNWRKNDVYLPLSYLTRILGFDDESSAVSFFHHYGLNCDILENRVLIDRLIKPDVEYAMDRALQLVESKRITSVGECVFGKTLPPASLFEHHQPHNSFDVNGMLNVESWTADDQLREIHSETNVQYVPQNNTSFKDLSARSDTNVFKMPQILAPISPKQQRQIEQNAADDTQRKVFDTIIVKKEETFSPAGFKFSGNIFTTNATNNNILKTDARPEQTSFLNTIFKSNTVTPISDVYGVVATTDRTKSANIFGEAARETVNIFQNQSISKDFFKVDNVFQHFQSNREPPSCRNNSSENNIIDNNILIHNIALKNELKEKIEKNQREKNKLRDLEEKCLREQRKREEDHERQRLDQLKINLKEKSEQETEVILIHSIEEEISRIAQAEILIYQAVEKASELQIELLITEVVNECVDEISHEEYALMCYDQLLLHRYFSRWLLHLRKKKEQRRLIENTPLWVTTDTRAQFAQAIEHPCQQETLGMIKRYRLGQPCDFQKILNIERDVLQDENQNPLNLFALVGQHLLGKRNFPSCGILQQRKYFKILITLPGSNEELLGFESFSNKWLRQFIEKSQTEIGPFVLGIEHNVALCVRKFNGIIPKNEQGDIVTTEGDHNDGIVCFISGIEIERHSRKRLFNLLKLTKNLKRVPLAIIAYNCTYNKEQLAEMLCLDMLQEEGLIYSYNILGCRISRKEFSFRKLFINAIDFVTKESYSLNINEIHALAMQKVLPFLETSLGEEMWQRWLESAKGNPIFYKICCQPKHVVGLFHKSLDHLLHITQEDFDEMPEFPIELKEFVSENTENNIPLGLEYFPVNWKTNAKASVIKSFLKSLYLPDIEEIIPENIEDIKLWILNYTSKCIENDELVSANASYEAITNLVNQIKFQYLQNIELTSTVNMLNYLTIMKPIVFANINKKLRSFHNDLININVVYLKDDFKNYLTQPWWLNYGPLNLITVDYNENPSSSPQDQTLPQTNNENCASAEAIDKIIAKAELTSRKAEENISKFKNSIRHKIPSLNTSSNLQLKRTLDDSLYQFELSKKTGQYDDSYVTDLTHDIDKSINEFMSQSSPTTQKRKRLNLKSPNRCSDIDNALAKARNLILKIESMEDEKLRRKSIKK